MRLPDQTHGSIVCFAETGCYPTGSDPHCQASREILRLPISDRLNPFLCDSEDISGSSGVKEIPDSPVELGISAFQCVISFHGVKGCARPCANEMDQHAIPGAALRPGDCRR
jgi:hypothetical protein